MLNMAFSYLFLFVVFVRCSTAQSLDELKQQYVNMFTECAESGYAVSQQELEQLQAKQMPGSENAKCLFACFYKKAGMMNDQGLLSVENVLEMSRVYLSNNPEKMEKAIEFTEACKSVNDVQVSDGDRGCDRAELMFQCTVEKAPQFDFVV